MMNVELEVMVELRACASLTTVARSIDVTPLLRVQVTAPPETEQDSVPAATAREAPVQTARAAMVNVANSFCLCMMIPVQTTSAAMVDAAVGL